VLATLDSLRAARCRRHRAVAFMRPSSSTSGTRHQKPAAGPDTCLCPPAMRSAMVCSKFGSGRSAARTSGTRARRAAAMGAAPSCKRTRQRLAGARESPTGKRRSLINWVWKMPMLEEGAHRARLIYVRTPDAIPAVHRLVWPSDLRRIPAKLLCWSAQVPRRQAHDVAAPTPTLAADHQRRSEHQGNQHTAFVVRIQDCFDKVFVGICCVRQSSRSMCSIVK
jgi:hypothetical protein